MKIADNVQPDTIRRSDIAAGAIYAKCPDCGLFVPSEAHETESDFVGYDDGSHMEEILTYWAFGCPCGAEWAEWHGAARGIKIRRVVELAELPVTAFALATDAGGEETS